MYDKIYSRPRIKIFRKEPKQMKITKNKSKNNLVNNTIIKSTNRKREKLIITVIIFIIAVITVKRITNSVEPIFNTICENRAKSIATIVSNEEATKVMKEHSYDEMYKRQKDKEDNITMITSNIIVINEITSEIAVKIQRELDNKGREDISIALRKFHRIKTTCRKRSRG